jgi:penicillin-binding protein 1A
MLVLGIWGAVALAGLVAYYAATLPPTSEWAVPKRPPNVRIVAENGETIATRGDTGGESLTLAEMPRYLPEAVMAIEDRRFKSHFGLDPIGLARAIFTNLRAGDAVQGGSTLTQQLAKNLFLQPDRTLQRKMQEVVLSLWLEAKFSKDEILEMYLNRVYLGGGAYGVDAAARRYFGKSAREVTIPEAAMIAGLLKAPSRYAPTRDPEAARDRAGLVLQAMREEGYITDGQLKQALADPATVVARPLAASAGYVADWVMDQLPGFLGSFTEDIVVDTTIDTTIQRAAEQTLAAELAASGGKYGVTQGAVVVMDGAGAVKGLVGGRDYQASQFNRAVVARRQPGSSFKPFVYLAALERGLTPDTVRVDQPVAIGKWRPENYTKKYYGPVPLRRALANSLNTISVQLVQEVGAQTVADTAHRMGIVSPLNANGSIALGTSEVTLLELTSAYVPFSNGGFGVVPHVIRAVRSEDGDLLYQRKGGGPGQVISSEQVGQMNSMLSEALLSGTAQRARVAGWPAAGKTGTSQDFRDAWFVGYTGYFTAGVWLGNDDGTPTKRATGGTLPAKLWGELMAKVHDGMQVADLPGARASSTDAIAGLIPEDGPSPVPPPQAVEAAPGAPTPAGRGQAGSRIIPGAEPADGGGFLKKLFGG